MISTPQPNSHKNLGVPHNAQLPEGSSTRRNLFLKRYPKAPQREVKGRRLQEALEPLEDDIKRKLCIAQVRLEADEQTRPHGRSDHVPQRPSYPPTSMEKVNRGYSVDGIPGSPPIGSPRDTRDTQKTALRGGTDEEESRQIEVKLPLILAERWIVATPDTGSDRNVMSADMARHLGLRIERDSSHNIFKLANGRVMICRGKVSTHFAFPFDFEETPAVPIEFHILQPLVAPVIVGRPFLDATETLKTHLSRLIRTPRPSGMTLSPPRILHLSVPRRTLQCFVNSTLVQANADTGAEMNLASPEFVARAGFRLEPPDQRHQFVQLADGSICPISGCFRARFNPYEKPSPKTLRPRAHMKTFYVLDGLTSDVLLGHHLLFEIYAFVEQTNAFLEMECPELHIDLNLIAWLERWRNKLSSNPVEHASCQCSLTSIFLSVYLQMVNPEVVQEIDSSFWRDLDTDDAREQRQRQKVEANKNAIVSVVKKKVMMMEESQRQKRYDQRRQQRIEAHEAQMISLRTG